MVDMITKIVEKLEHMVTLRSLRARLFVIILAVGIIPGVLMRYGIVDNYEDRAVENRIAVVQNQLMILANHLVSNNYLTTYKSEDQTYRSSRAVINAELEMLSNLYEGRVMIINNNLINNVLALIMVSYKRPIRRCRILRYIVSPINKTICY